MTDTEIAVVGAGLLGLATARALARRGREVLVLEASHVGHERAGSKGSARIFRYGYDDLLYVRMALKSEPLWHELEAESEKSLLETTGQVTYGRDLHLLADALASCGAPYERVGPDEVAERWPLLRAAEAVVEPRSGVLVADRCLEALLRTGTFALREQAPVLAVEVAGERLRLRLADDDVTARVAVICAGASTGALARTHATRLPRQTTTLEQVCYFEPEEPGQSLVEVPIVIERSNPLWYGLPSPPALPRTYKAGLHVAGPAVDLGTAELTRDAALVAATVEQARALLPGVALRLAATERCPYDNSPDEDFILDRIGNVVVGCGTSGHGFKFGPYLGERLADLALGLPLEEDLARFRLR